MSFEASKSLPQEEGCKHEVHYSTARRVFPNNFDYFLSFSASMQRANTSSPKPSLNRAKQALQRLSWHFLQRGSRRAVLQKTTKKHRSCIKNVQRGRRRMIMTTLLLQNQQTWHVGAPESLGWAISVHWEAQLKHNSRPRP